MPELLMFGYICWRCF